MVQAMKVIILMTEGMGLELKLMLMEQRLSSYIGGEQMFPSLKLYGYVITWCDHDPN